MVIASFKVFFIKWMSGVIITWAAWVILDEYAKPSFVRFLHFHINPLAPCYTNPIPMESFEKNIAQAPQSKNELMEKAEQLQAARVEAMKWKDQLSIPVEPSKAVAIIKGYRDAVLAVQRIEEEFNDMKQVKNMRLEEKFGAGRQVAESSANDSDFDRALYASGEEQQVRKIEVRRRA